MKTRNTNTKPKLKPFWISATHVFNYMIKDSLVDWLKKRNRKTQINSNNSNNSNNVFLSFLMKKGVEFEKRVIQIIHKKVPVQFISDKITPTSLAKTLECMKKGVPVLHSVPLQNNLNNTQGIADLVVRSDYVSKLFNICPLTNDEEKIGSPLLKKKFHYIVIDIKFSTLPLRADGEYLLNSKNFPAYKSQLLIYRDAIGLLQGYTSDYGFVLGRRWKYTSKGKDYSSFNCLDKLGKINFKTVDKNFVSDTKKAIKWLNDVNTNGHKWKIHPPSKKELYPNMCIDSGIWNQEKKEIADNIGEITSILYCGQKERQLALKQHVKSWKDPKFTSSIVNIRGQRGKIIDKIVEINRQNDKCILPQKIQSTTHGWFTEDNEMFVDFETLADMFSSFSELPESRKTDIIFMIGVYYKNKKTKKWQYKKFICPKNTEQDELQLMKAFYSFVISQGSPKLWYWCADHNFWRQAEKKHNTSFSELKWVDLMDVFQKEPIVIKNCFSYKLKDLSSAMHSHGLIKKSVENLSCSSGMTAMVLANEWYTNPKKNKKIMQDIETYNRFDCEVMYDMLSCIRKYI